MRCPSCDEPTLSHADWHLDEYAPNHKPVAGQRIWIDLTVARAEEIARRTRPDATDEQIQQAVAAFFAHGTPPDIQTHGGKE
jgi:hypothetical protein